MQGGEKKCARTVDGRCPDQGDSRFSSSREEKDFKIESKDRNLPSGKLEDVNMNVFVHQQIFIHYLIIIIENYILLIYLPHFMVASRFFVVVFFLYFQHHCQNICHNHHISL